MASDFSELDRFARDLRRAPAKVQKDIIGVLDKAAADVQRGAAARAPVDTGALRNSIGTSNAGRFARDIGPTVNYGMFVEYGTSRMGPQPFMGPALEAARPSFEQAIAELGIDL